MKLQEHNYGFEGNLPENRTPFKIKTSAKLFDILSSGIYKDKILAVIRELSCNAYDAHVSVGKKHVPFKLRMPTRLDPTFYVEDEGTGIDPERITDIYWTYGESSKTNSNDQIGALGLGSKSPFAYTKSSFVVKNRYNGTEYTYLCFINEDGMPDGSLVGQESTTFPSGVTVEFAVRPEDIGAFFNRADRFFKYWEATKPVFVDLDTNDVLISEVEKVVEGNGWFLERSNRDRYSDHTGAIALQGNVPYPIEVSSIPKLPKELEIIASNPFVITFDMGSINFASSREALQYDERTCSNIISRLAEVRTEIEKSFREKVFAPGMTHLEFMQNFRRTFREFTETIRYTGGGYGVDTDEWYVEMLLDKKKEDSISYGKIEFNIEDLIKGRRTIKTTGHQKFGIYRLDRKGRSRSSRQYMVSLTNLTYTSTKKIGKGIIHTQGWMSANEVAVGSDFHFDWRSTFVSPRAEPKIFENIMKNSSSFTVETRNNLLINTGVHRFYLNDVGSSGEARFKLLANQSDGESFFVNFDSKVSNFADVQSDFKALVNDGLQGVEIVLISSQPDLRPAIEKTKIETGKLRLRSRQVILEPKEVLVSYDNSSIRLKEVEVIIEVEEILPLADLVAMKVVPYVSKRRSPNTLYDDIAKDNSVKSILTDTSYMQLSIKMLLGDLVVPFTSSSSHSNWSGRDSLRVLVLNDGQIEWLKKRKVNVKPLRTIILERIEALEKTEKFREAIEHIEAMKRVALLRNFAERIVHYSALKVRLDTDVADSVFKTLLKEYQTIVSGKTKLSDQYAKNHIYERVAGGNSHVALGRAQADSIAETLDEKYPMLGLINLYGGSADQFTKIIDYIEQQDKV